MTPHHLTVRVVAEFAWAAYCTDGSPRPFIHTNSVRSTARDAREYIGIAWARSGEHAGQGWKRAYRAGWRVIRVKVEAAFVGGSHVAPPEWQPIETAPKDGTVILGLQPEKFTRIRETWWLAPSSMTQEWRCRESPGSWHPTHWMPLPAPPSTVPQASDPAFPMSTESMKEGT